MTKQKNNGEDDELKPIYWDDVKKSMYWIEWYDTGNGDIPTRHYLNVHSSVCGSKIHSS